ncbi:Rad4-domain-containing protein [Gonapodya prolifera JEL478]|uniref:Rad4-domain-containing protein n=1 Tax=Gonapodya prolifera (strain JEL478) TaxID=1344416 RepID=A0A139A9Z4_GONPJ|nr:Rad4-domain-containing protein [Gonapodya prolifera JEL478]|eukprot:KXS13547.1 Rad4-domain-containing protein [Gonapodya prolifera JEL478]
MLSESKMAPVASLSDLTPRYTSSSLTPNQNPSEPGFFSNLCALFASLTDSANAVDASEIVRKSAAMPTRMDDFRNHPIYALERHLKQTEIIHPLRPVLGQFRGEKIYPRENVKSLKSSDAWWKEGRQVMEGADPLKWVKRRVSTIRARREVEAEKMGYNISGTRSKSKGKGKAAMRYGGESDEDELGDDGPMDSNAPEPGMVGLYGEWQTSVYIPPPVIDGVVPKNSFGNIDLYKKSMLPNGSRHIRLPGIGQIAKKLGVDYADAVVGFEFSSGRSHPVLDGIVVAEEYTELLTGAVSEVSALEAQVEWDKKSRRAISNWRKLTRGLAMKEQLKREWGWNGEVDASEVMKESINPDDPLRKYVDQRMEEAEVELDQLVQERQSMDADLFDDNELEEELGRRNRRRKRQVAASVEDHEDDEGSGSSSVRPESTPPQAPRFKKKRRAGIVSDSDSDVAMERDVESKEQSENNVGGGPVALSAALGDMDDWEFGDESGGAGVFLLD